MILGYGETFAMNEGSEGREEREEIFLGFSLSTERGGEKEENL